MNYNNHFRQNYVEIPAFTQNEKGEFLNKTSVSILKLGDKVDVHAEIQEYAKQCSIYEMLKKFELTSDESYLNRDTTGFYVDISDIPNNAGEFIEKFKTEVSKMKAEALAKEAASKAVEAQKNEASDVSKKEGAE